MTKINCKYPQYFDECKKKLFITHKYETKDQIFKYLLNEIDQTVQSNASKLNSMSMTMMRDRELPTITDNKFKPALNRFFSDSKEITIREFNSFLSKGKDKWSHLPILFMLAEIKRKNRPHKWKKSEVRKLIKLNGESNRKRFDRACEKHFKLCKNLKFKIWVLEGNKIIGLTGLGERFYRLLQKSEVISKHLEYNDVESIRRYLDKNIED